jgi:PAS domain S-box-containing protein
MIVDLLGETELAKPLGEGIYRTLFEQCPVGVAVLGLDQRILKANPRLRALLGDASGGLEGRGLLEAVHPEQRPDVARAIERLRLGQTDGVRLECRLLREDGSALWAELGEALIRDEGGAARHIVAVVEDIASRKKTEADLIRSNAELELYASVAAHDLQEPVRKVITYGEILAKLGDRLPDEGKAALAKSRAAALRMKELIDDLLEYARVNAVKRASAPVDLNVVLKEVLAELSAGLAERSGRVEVGKLPVVDADALQMRQLFQNLLTNAIKFTPPGRPPMIAVTSEPLEGGRVRLEVKDQGIGFDEKYLDRIFRPFQRVCDKNLYPGSGIGLAICQSVVQRHGGSITARSAPGKGASFRVVLPLRRSGN